MSIRIFYLFILSILALSGCVSAHKYSAVGNAKSMFAGKAFNVGSIEVAGGKDGKVNNPEVRLGTMSSPYNDSYAEYLKRALIMELAEANKYSDGGNFIISGKLLKNEITSPVLEPGKMTIAANFIIKKNGRIVFDDVIEHSNTWNVPFAGDDARRVAPRVYLQTMNEFIGIAFKKIDSKLAH